MRYAKHLAFIRQASRSTTKHAEQISSANFSDSAKERFKQSFAPRVESFHPSCRADRLRSEAHGEFSFKSDLPVG
jgi:hypothetical protein